MMTMRGTVRCFVAWLQHTGEMRQLRQRAMAHFSGNLSYFCFHRWRAWQAEQRERLVLFGERMRRGGEWRALSKWVAFREAALERARRRQEEEKRVAAERRAEAEAEAARAAREAEMQELRAVANSAAERHAEAVAQLEEAAVQVGCVCVCHGGCGRVFCGCNHTRRLDCD